MKTIVLTEAVHEAGMALLRSRDDVEVVVAQGFEPQGLREAIAQAQAIGVRTARLDPETLALASKLQVVSKHGVGCDNIAVEYLTARNIPVAIAADANAASVAEHTLMLMLAAAKRLTEYDAAARSGRWDMRKTPISTELGGRDVLVIGFGRIGRRVAALCRAFGMHVLVHDVAATPDAIEPEGYELAPDLDAALERADFVTLHIPYSPAAANLLDATRIARIKRGAILVNCARGGIVDEAALVDALRRGRIAAAGLDVFDQEPPPPDHPLFSLPNVALTPHNASLTPDGARKMAVSMARNILDCFDGQLDPKFVVNPKVLLHKQ